EPSNAERVMTSTRDFTDRAGADDGAELDRLRAELAEWRRRYATGELRDIAFVNSAREVEALYTALDTDPQTAENLGVPGTHPFDGLSRQALDDAPVRRLRQRARHECAVQVPARARPNGSLDGVRLSDADGLRLRPSAIARRSRQDRCGDLEPRRHGGAVRRH